MTDDGGDEGWSGRDTLLAIVALSMAAFCFCGLPLGRDYLLEGAANSYDVTSANMLPTIKVGDQVTMTPYEDEEPVEPGDIIAMAFPQEQAGDYLSTRPPGLQHCLAADNLTAQPPPVICRARRRDRR